jgi:tetratricopeptide (TPR) repeat protein
MSFRSGAVGAIMIFALALAGCASPGNGAPDARPAISDEDLPQWMQDLPEGEPPRDNEYTDQATLFLIQAMGSEGEDRAGFLDLALEAAREGIEADPENPQSYYQAGEALLGLDRLEEAAQMFDRAEEIYPRYVIETEFLREEAWLEAFNQGAELSQAGSVEAAVPHFERAHAIYQHRPEAMLNLAEIYQNQGRTDEAIGLYARSVEVMTSPRAEEMDDEFKANWDTFMEVARFNQAQLLFQQERYAEAAAIYEAILEEEPENLMAISNLAVALVAQGRGDEARAIYDDLLNRPGLTARDFFSIGVGLYQSDDFEQAARAFGETFERVPGHRDAIYNMAQSLYLADDFEALLEATRPLLEVDTHNENAYRFRAQSLVQLDRQDEAIAVLEEMEALPFYVDALELQPANGGVAILGLVINQHQDPGTQVRLRVHVYDEQGSRLGSEDVTVQLGAPEEAVQFQGNVSVEPRSAFGFRYEVL